MEAEDMPEPAVFENAIWSYQEYKDRLERLRQFPETMAFLVDNMRVTRWAGGPERSVRSALRLAC